MTEFEMKIIKEDGLYKIETIQKDKTNKIEIPEFKEKKFGKLIFSWDNKSKVLRYIKKFLQNKIKEVSS